LGAGVGRIESYIGKVLERGRMSRKAAEAARAAHIPTMEINDLAYCTIECAINQKERG
jgi:hypothetical protein